MLKLLVGSGAHFLLALLLACVCVGIPVVSCLIAAEVDLPTSISVGALAVVFSSERFL